MQGAGEREAVKVEARRPHDRGHQFGVIAGITASEQPVDLTLGELKAGDWIIGHDYEALRVARTSRCAASAAACTLPSPISVPAKRSATISRNSRRCHGANGAASSRSVAICASVNRIMTRPPAGVAAAATIEAGRDTPR